MPLWLTTALQTPEPRGTNDVTSFYLSSTSLTFESNFGTERGFWRKSTLSFERLCR